MQDDIDSAFTYSLIHPDSLRYLAKNWKIEQPTPIEKSKLIPTHSTGKST